MNRQDLIKEYKEYGFSDEEISKELRIPILLVKSALIEDKPMRTYTKAKSLRYKSAQYDKNQATDRTWGLYEILYEYEPDEFNRLLKKLGYNDLPKYIGYDRNDIVALKMHYGYNNAVPRDALEHICYFSEKLRRQVDERDNRTCIRCGRKCTTKNIRYHKISHPGAMTVDNCATLCFYCRSHRILKHYDLDITRFQGMDFDTFVKWVHKHDAFQHRNRVYPPGQVGKWKT